MVLDKKNSVTIHIEIKANNYHIPPLLLGYYCHDPWRTHLPSFGVLCEWLRFRFVHSSGLPAVSTLKWHKEHHLYLLIWIRWGVMSCKAMVLGYLALPFPLNSHRIKVQSLSQSKQCCGLIISQVSLCLPRCDG